MPLTRADLRDAMKALALQLDATPFGDRSALIAAACGRYAMSRAALYRRLQSDAGWTSGRRVRVDKGTTAQSDDGLAVLAAMQKAAVRQNGKSTMNLTTAVSVAAQNGVDLAVGPARLRALLRQRGLDVRTQAREASHVEMRSLHPNHVHQVDASLCLVYYLNGEQHVIRDDQLYKNKLAGLAKARFKVYRWVLVDHCSHVIVPWYTEAAGEDQFSLAEFLLFAWSRQDGRPFHGVPQLMVWDKGAANQSHAVKGLLRALEVQEIAHATGNSRAKGSVEVAQNIVETQFESRLRFEPVTSVAELNAAATAWANAYNANQIPGQDTRLDRGHLHLSRYDLWLRIREEQLRLLPDAELCRALLAGREETRRVHDGLQIQFRHPSAASSLRYDVRACTGLSVGDVVAVQPMLYGDCAILVSVTDYRGERREWKVEPIRDYDANGFRESAPVFGQSFKSNPQTINEAAGKALDRVAYGEKPAEEIDQAKRANAAPFGGLMDAHSHLGKIDLPTYLPRKGTDITVPDRVAVTEAPLSRVAAGKALVAILGRGLTFQENQKLGTWYPDGVPEKDLPQIATALRTGTTPFRHLGDKEATG